MTVRLSPTGRSVQNDLSDTSRNVIEAIFAAVLTRAVFCVVLNSSTTVAASPEQEDDGWKTLKVQ